MWIPFANHDRWQPNDGLGMQAAPAGSGAGKGREMISVTRRAAVEIRGLLKPHRPTQSRARGGHVLRLTFDGRSGIAMGLGAPAADDVVIGDADGPVLAISAGLAPRLDGLVFDWIIAEVQGLGRGGFSFRPRLDEDTELLGPDTL
jgi:hypothetical protein